MKTRLLIAVETDGALCGGCPCVEKPTMQPTYCAIYFADLSRGGRGWARIAQCLVAQREAEAIELVIDSSRRSLSITPAERDSIEALDAIRAERKERP